MVERALVWGLPCWGHTSSGLFLTQLCIPWGLEGINQDYHGVLTRLGGNDEGCWCPVP